jgi:hypothetical protein
LLLALAVLFFLLICGVLAYLSFNVSWFFFIPLFLFGVPAAGATLLFLFRGSD